MSVLRTRLFVEDPSKFVIEFVLITTMMLNHFEELEGKELTFFKENASSLDPLSALIELINIVFAQHIW